MKIRISAFILLVITLVVVTSCKKNHYKVNISSIKADIEIKRLEEDLFSVNPDDIIDTLPLLKKKYGRFLQLFSYVINTGDINESSFGDFLLSFCTDKQNYDVYSLTKNLYPDITWIEE